jgi:hypothetical protein
MPWPGWERFGMDVQVTERDTKRQPRVKNAQPTEIDGHLFPSKHEAACYQDLLLRQTAGEIEDLRIQVRFPLEVNGVVVTTYVADFTFREGGRLRVLDAKGMRTEVYRLKKRLFEALHTLRIEEV